MAQPLIDIKQLEGIMNLDTPNAQIPPTHHKKATNVRFRNGRIEGVPGTVLISNSFLPVGTNQCIGAFNDSKRRRIIWFNYNSNGRNGIYSYSYATKTLSKIFLCFTDSATDILGFSRDLPIHSAVIVYRTETDGDLLYWTDGSFGSGNRPRGFNIDTVSTLAPFTVDMVNAGKNAPLREPGVLYKDDAQRISNNLRKQLFQFCYRWVYKDLSKSTCSPISELPLPPNAYNVDTQNDPTKNNNIQIGFRTGGKDFQKVEILGRVGNGQVWSDFFSIITLDRTDNSYNADSDYFYYFYNDGNYVTADLTDADKTFSYLPDKANTLELLNGNVIVYGGITEGYDAITRANTNVVVSSGIGNASIASFSFVYSGANAFTAFIGSVITVGVTYTVTFNYNSTHGGDASPVNQSYVTMGGDTQNSITASIVALINGAAPNITATNLGAGVMRVACTDISTGTITNVTTTVSTAGTAVAQAAWNISSQERLGIIYFDDRGKTNGVVYFPQNSAIDTNVFDVNTPIFTTSSNVIQIPYLSASINHTPPTWATMYQWVRVPKTPKFLQWITNDYQTDATNLYICIQNLTYTQSKTSGYVPTYDFSKGDRIKILASYNSGTGFYTPYNLQLDMEVLGVVDRTMNSPATTGRFIKVAKPTTFPSAAYSANMLIQIYTPTLNAEATDEIFYEWGKRYVIYEFSAGVRMHAGQVTNQTPSQPATFKWFDGDVYFRNRDFYLNVNDATTISAFMFDANYSDYFSSKLNSNGRGWVIDAEAKTTYNPVMLRWGGKYQQDTNINQINIFQPADFDTIDRAKGDICRLLVEERLLYVYQQKGVGMFGVYAKYIQNNEGNPQLVTTNEIITANNVNYLQGDYGLGNQPCAVWRGEAHRHYFVDDTKGQMLRRSGDGFENLSELYYGKYFIKNLITPYNSTYLRPDGSKAKIIGFYDFFEGNSQTILQGGTYSGNTILDYNFSFNEARNAFESFYEYFPDWAVQGDAITYSWKDGQLYVHNNEDKWCYFYNQQKYPSITLVFNKDVALKKIFNSVAYQGNQIWTSPTNGDINTSLINSQTGFQQISQLIKKDYEVMDDLRYAAFLRDANSMTNAQLALNEGDYLNGVYMEITFVYQGSEFSFLFLPYVNFQPNPRNF